MPTYEYVCTECGVPLEVVQSIHEPSLTQCPACQGRLRKVFGNVGVVFKGSGFYRTDSRGKSSAGAASAPKGDSKGDAKGDSKGDAKGDSKGAGSTSGSSSGTTPSPSSGAPAATSPAPSSSPKKAPAAS